MLKDQIKHYLTLMNLTFVFSLAMSIWLIWYFYTGFGGPSELATYLLPIALIVQMLFMYQEGYLYKRLPPVVNHIIILY